MKNSKLYNLYNLLTQKEKKKFARWLEFELNGSKPELLLFRKYLDQDAERMTIWKGLFPGEAFNDAKFRNRIKLLHEYLEEFILIIYVRKQKERKGLFFLLAISERNPSHEYFSKALKKAQKKLNDEGIWDDQYYYIQYRINLMENQFAYQNQDKAQLKTLQNVNDSFDSYFIMAKLKLALMNRSYKRKNLHISTRFLEPISEEMKSGSEFANQPPVQMSFLTYKLLEGGEPDEAQKLRDYMKEYDHLITPSNYGIMYNILLNFYIRKINRGYEGKLYSTIFDLYIDGIERGILMTNGFLPAQHVANLVKIGIAAGEFKKAREYLSFLAAKVPPHLQEDVLKFNKALILFEEEKFREASNLIVQKGSGFKIDIMEIQARYLVLKCNYELGIPIETSEVDNISRALKRRDQIPIDAKKNYRKRFKYFKKLIRAFSEEDYQSLWEELQKEDVFGDKKWILEKIQSKIPQQGTFD